jgi:5-methylcytosine-specific restriction endonuclease McrA
VSNQFPEYRSGCTALEVDRSLKRTAAVYTEARRHTLLWFHEVLSRRLYTEFGHASMLQYATQRLGFTKNRTWQFLRLARDMDRLPPLQEAVESGSLEWTKAQQVGRIATPETARDWVDAAKSQSRRELDRSIKNARQRAANGGAQELPLPDTSKQRPRPASARISKTLTLEAADLARLESMIEAAKKAGSIPSKASREEAILIALDHLVSRPGDDLRRRNDRPPTQVVMYRCESCGKTEVATAEGRRPVAPSEADLAIEDAIVQKEGKSRHTIAPSVRAAVLERDGHRCRAPGCGTSRFLELHHLVPRRLGGAATIDNLVTLCRRCHRFLHTRDDLAAATASLFRDAAAASTDSPPPRQSGAASSWPSPTSREDSSRT